MEHVLLDVQDIYKTYFPKKTGPKKALKKISFQIHEGEIFALLGVNGAGKTTLSGILSGLHPPSSGDILWKGKSIYHDLPQYRKIVGLCPQKPNIDPGLTLQETLLFCARCYGKSLSEAEKQKDHLLELFDLKNYADADVKHLSGGYKQRFLLSRTLAHHPKFIILDEPTVGLDAHIRKALWEIISSLKNEGATILLTTHYLEEAETLSDRVCFLDHGEIKILDPPENLNKHYQKTNLEDVFLHLMEEQQKEVE